jgi:hypothetical protein
MKLGNRVHWTNLDNVVSEALRVSMKTGVRQSVVMYLWSSVKITYGISNTVDESRDIMRVVYANPTVRARVIWRHQGSPDLQPALPARRFYSSYHVNARVAKAIESLRPFMTVIPHRGEDAEDFYLRGANGLFAQRLGKMLWISTETFHESFVRTLAGIAARRRFLLQQTVDAP